MLLYLFSGGPGGYLARLFGRRKQFFDGQWPIIGRYLKGWLNDGNVDWDFSATCHGKGDIDDLGSTCKRRVHEKTLPTALIYKTILIFPNVLLMCVLESSFFIALKQMLKKLKQHLTIGHWHTNKRAIYSIPRKAH